MTTVLPTPTVPTLGQTPPLTPAEAFTEANRCLYCSDAPCMQACPTHIDIPEFIKKISTGNLTGSAKTILQSNFLGGTCARVCPVEELCEGACVLNKADKPIEIGRLQRYATDHLADEGIKPFEPAAPTGSRVLVIGSGPAGLSAAAELAKLGHEVTVRERRALAGGLSTYGIITLREPVEVAQAEVSMVEDLGVTVYTNSPLNSAEELAQVASEYDAVFLALGLGSVPALDIPGGEHIIDGLDYIATVKTDPDNAPQPTRVAVIGAGNTAIDAATTARLQGAQATIVYRRTAEDMSAFDHEYVFAVRSGIEFTFLAAPAEVITDDNGVTGLRCTRMLPGEPDTHGCRNVIPSGDPDVIIPCDAVISAIGQTKFDGDTGLGLPLDHGYLSTTSSLRSTTERLPNVFAGGDAVRATGDASTVMAVQDGKIAAKAIHEFLGTEHNNG